MSISTVSRGRHIPTPRSFWPRHRGFTTKSKNWPLFGKTAGPHLPPTGCNFTPLFGSDGECKTEVPPLYPSAKAHMSAVGEYHMNTPIVE